MQQGRRRALRSIAMRLVEYRPQTRTPPLKCFAGVLYRIVTAGNAFVTATVIDEGDQYVAASAIHNNALDGGRAYEAVGARNLLLGE